MWGEATTQSHLLPVGERPTHVVVHFFLFSSLGRFGTILEPPDRRKHRFLPALIVIFFSILDRVFCAVCAVWGARLTAEWSSCSSLKPCPTRHPLSCTRTWDTHTCIVGRQSSRRKKNRISTGQRINKNALFQNRHRSINAIKTQIIFLLFFSCRQTSMTNTEAVESHVQMIRENHRLPEWMRGR